MDLHADQIQGFFDVPVDHLYASGVILPYLQSLRLKDMVIASPDVGGSKRANTYAKYFGCPLVLCNKTRARACNASFNSFVGLFFNLSYLTSIFFFLFASASLLK